MRKGLFTLGLLVAGALVAREAAAQVPSAPSTPANCENTCVGDADGPRQGRHTDDDATADAVLWPPNHKLQTLTITAANEKKNPCDVTITNATQDEALDEPGSGNTSPDATNCDNRGNTSYIDLRAERAGTGDGRYYHVDYSMHDPDCESAADKSGQAKVLVPHDQGAKKVWLDDATAFFPSYDGVMLQCAEDE